MGTSERIDQKRRTRQDMLQAATRLMKRGRAPTLAEVAEEAMVSRATAYRYFSSEETLLLEAPLHESALAHTPERVFLNDPSTNPEERLLKADATMREFVWENQTQLRLMLSRLLDQAARANGAPAEPLRLNRRLGLIEAALAPARYQFDNGVYKKLCAALSLVIGTESMLVFRDVLQMDAPAAWEVESWVVRALTRAALAESAQIGDGKPGKPAPRKSAKSGSAKRRLAK